MAGSHGEARHIYNSWIRRSIVCRRNSCTDERVVGNSSTDIAGTTRHSREDLNTYRHGDKIQIRAQYAVCDQIRAHSYPAVTKAREGRGATYSKARDSTHKVRRAL